MPRNHDPFGGAGQDGASSRRDERSGLLDIRALSSVIDAQRRARTSSASASSVALPAFTSPWLLQDVSAPAPAPARSSAAPRRAVADQRSLHLMILGLSAAVVGLGAYAVLRPAPPVVVEQAPVVVAGPAVPEPEPAQDSAAVAAPPADEASEVDEASEADEASETDEASDVEPKTKRSRAHRSRTPRSRAKTEPKVEPKTEPKTKSAKKEPKDGGVLPVECVIDPSKCSTGKRKGGSDAAALGSTKGLPASPSSSQIRSAMAKVKPQAKACRGRHGGRDGEKVRVKLSVEGATGRVTSAKPLEDHARTALGRCVADALAKAGLPRFSKPQVGVVYAITL